MSKEAEGSTEAPESPGMTAFDQIDIHADVGSQEQTPINDILSHEAKEEAPEKVEATEEDEVVASEEEEESDDTEESEESAEDKETKSEDEAPKPDDVEPPTVIKTKYNDEELELYGDTQIPTMVAGKEQTPTLQELRENYSGKVNWDKKFRDLAEDKKGYQKERITFDQQKQEMESLVNQLVETARGEDPFQFFDVIAEMLGQDPVQLKEEVVRNQVKQVEPVAHMSDDEKEQYFEKLKLKWERESIDRFKRTKTQQEESARHQAKVEEVRTKYGLSEDDYREAYALAEKNLTDEKPTVDHVVWIHRHQLATEAVHKVREEWVGGLDPDSETDVAEYNSVIGRIRTIAVNNPEFTQGDLEEIITDAFEEKSSAAKTLSKKVNKTSSGVKAKTPEKTKAKKELTSFDQLGDI